MPQGEHPGCSSACLALHQQGRLVAAKEGKLISGRDLQRRRAGQAVVCRGTRSQAATVIQAGGGSCCRLPTHPAVRAGQAVTDLHPLRGPVPGPERVQEAAGVKAVQTLAGLLRRDCKGGRQRGECL